MKFIFILITIVVIANSLSLRKTEEPVLSTTPKGRSLHDHFGLSASHSPYGPPPSLNLDNLMIKNADNSWTAVPSPAFNGSNISPSGSQCDITQHAFYKICNSVTDCGLCAVMESCGWCEETQKCLPGNIDGCFCKDDCPQLNFFTTKLKCKTQVQGYLNVQNISPESSKLIAAQITGPKINVTNTVITPGWQSVPVILGDKTERREITTLNLEENRIVSQEANVTERVVGNINLPKINVNIETKTYDFETGKEIISNNTIGFHGK